MKLPRKLIGEYVLVRFLDHTESHSDVVECAATGELISIEPTFIRIRGWHCDVDRGVVEDHTEWCIVRSTIVGLHRVAGWETIV